MFNDSLEKQLKIAVLEGNLEIAKSLFKKGAKVEDPDWEKMLTVECFLQTENIDTRKDMLKLLLENGFDPVAIYQNSDRNNFLNDFIEFGVKEDEEDAVEIVEIILNAGVPLERDEEICPLLFSSIEANHFSLISFFIKKGVDVKQEFKNYYKKYPLSASALHECSVDIIDLLISNGADVNDKDDDGNTALHHACFMQYEETISFLIHRGADVCAENNKKLNPFHLLIYDPRPVDDYDQCLKAVIKGFSKLIFENFPNSKKYIDLIRTNPRALEHFKECQTELRLMAGTIFYGSFSYYCALKMSKNIKKLAYLTKNDEFRNAFEANLSMFPYYEYDLKMLLKDAIRVRDQ